MIPENAVVKGFQERIVQLVGKELINNLQRGNTMIKRMLCMAREPKLAAHYLGKYSKIVVKLTPFYLDEAMHVDRHERCKRKLKRRGYLKMSRICVFTAVTDAAFRDYVKSDSELYRAILDQADRGLRNEFLILNETRPGMFDEKIGHYRWDEDFETGYHYAMCHYSLVRLKGRGAGSDIKLPWETARMQYLFSLGLAFWLTREEKYARKVKDIILDFIHTNPFDCGPNWNVSMEVGIRISNMILAAELIQGADCFDADFYENLASSAYEHLLHIKDNLENVGGRTSNHYLGDVLGLAAVSAAFPTLPDGLNTQKYVVEAIHRELDRQIQPDGSDFEGSTSYHRLVGELFCFMILAARKFGFELTASEKSKLLKMAEFDCALRMSNGLSPQVGDNDSGRVFQLQPEDSRDHGSCVRLLLALAENRTCRTGQCDAFECFMGLGLPELDLDTQRQKAVLFPDFSIARFDDGKIYFLLTNGCPEKVDMGGHAHNDLLSFTLAVNGIEFIVDPGSGEYTGKPKLRNALRCTGSHATVRYDGAEQRDLPESSLFAWGSKAVSTLSCTTHEGRTLIEGMWGRQSSGNMCFKRNVTIANGFLQIHDAASASVRECRMHLPLYPGTEAEIIGDEVVLRRQGQELRISGSWTFSLGEGFYAPQYKRINKNTVIIAQSMTAENDLSIQVC